MLTIHIATLVLHKQKRDELTILVVLSLSEHRICIQCVGPGTTYVPSAGEATPMILASSQSAGDQIVCC